MNHEISTKVYKLDFQELINNATNKEYWMKKWEIYNYDGMTVEFILNSIDIVNNKLIGCIKLNSDYAWSPRGLHNYSITKRKLYPISIG